MKYEIVYHIKTDPTNRIKKTLCGLEYGKVKHYAYIAPTGFVTSLGGPIEAEEICKRCLKRV